MLWRIKYTSVHLLLSNCFLPQHFYFHQFVNCIFFYRPTIFANAIPGSTSTYRDRLPKPVWLDFWKVRWGKRGNGKSMMAPMVVESLNGKTLQLTRSTAAFMSHVAAIVSFWPLFSFFFGVKGKLPLLFNIHNTTRIRTRWMDVYWPIEKCCCMADVFAWNQFMIDNDEIQQQYPVLRSVGAYFNKSPARSETRAKRFI